MIDLICSFLLNIVYNFTTTVMIFHEYKDQNNDFIINDRVVYLYFF